MRCGSRRAASLILAVILPLESGCRLAEVALPAAEDVLVVEAVLRAGARQQNIVLHRSVDGRTVRGEPGATVIVTPEGSAPLEFTESPLRDCIVGEPDRWDIEDLVVEAACYTRRLRLGEAVLPGQTFELRIQTAAGEIARGRTTVPGAFSITVPTIVPEGAAWSATCSLPDTAFTMVWTRSAGAWSYISSLRLSNWGDDLRAEGVEVPEVIELTGVSVTDADTTLLFPANLGLFQRTDYDQRLLLALQDGIPADADASFAVMAIDRNYTNAIRGGRFNPSGNVRSSSVVGDAVGVFGSVVPILIRSPGSTVEPRPDPC